MIGVISDTHGLLRPEAVDALRGSDLIIHAGDIGPLELIIPLRRLAPVRAVRGNVDPVEWGDDLPSSSLIEWNGIAIHVVHDIADLDLDPAGPRPDVVVYGHSHRPKIEERDGILFVNPGSAGPRRFKLPVTVARLHVRDGRVEAELVHLLRDG